MSIYTDRKTLIEEEGWELIEAWNTVYKGNWVWLDKKDYKGYDKIYILGGGSGAGSGLFKRNCQRALAKDIPISIRRVIEAYIIMGM